jgi:hypothetical protein
VNDDIRTAHHEAAHAVVARHLGLTIISATMTGVLRPGPGYRAENADDEPTHNEIDAARRSILVSFAGNHGSRLVVSRVPHGSGDDDEFNADALATRFFAMPFGLDDTQQRALLRSLKGESGRLVRYLAPAIRRVAHALRKRGELRGSDIDSLMWPKVKVRP